MVKGYRYRHADELQSPINNRNIQSWWMRGTTARGGSCCRSSGFGGAVEGRTVGHEWTELLIQRPLVGALPGHNGRRSDQRVAEVPCSFCQAFKAFYEVLRSLSMSLEVLQLRHLEASHLESSLLQGMSLLDSLLRLGSSWKRPIPHCWAQEPGLTQLIG